MVKTQLRIKADLENLEYICLDEKDSKFALRIQCANCKEIHQTWVEIDTLKVYQGTGRKHASHLLVKCKYCMRENSLDILENSMKQYTKDHSGTFSSLLEFDCRGLDLIDFKPQEGFKAMSDGNHRVFDNVDLSQREWVDYEEKQHVSVGIFNVVFDFIKK